MSPTSIASADLAPLVHKPGTKDEGPRTNDAVRAADPWALSAARLLLIATLIGAPWAYGAMVPWAWVALGLIASLALFLWALGAVQRGKLTLVWSPLYVPLAVFFLLGVVQYAARLTLDTAETRQALVLLAADLVFFFLAIQLFADAGRQADRAFGLLVLLFAAALGLFAILQFASGQIRIYGRFDLPTAFFGPYDNPDHFAGLMEMLVPVAVFYIAGTWPSHSLRSEPEPALSGAKGPARPPRPLPSPLAGEGSGVRGRMRAPRPPSPAVLLLLVLAVAIALASLLLTGSRGGMIALAAEVAIASVALQRLRRRQATARGTAWWTLAAAAVLGAALLFSWVDSGWASKRLALLVNVRSPNWVDKSRLAWTLDSLRMLRDHPALGVGLGNFGTAYPGYQSVPGDSWLDHAHDDYAEVIAETGLVGAALIGVTLALFVRRAFGDCGPRLPSAANTPSPPAPLPPRGEGRRNVEPPSPLAGESLIDGRSLPSPLAGEGGRRPGEGSAAGWVRLGAAIGCCGLLVHSLFDFNLHIPANAAWFAVLAGLAITGSGHRAIEPLSH